MNNDTIRLASFKNWPHKKPTASQLCRAGFMYIGDAQTPDLVECFMCGRTLSAWEETDDPKKEHQRRVPDCPFLNLHLEANRLKTFINWPHTQKNHCASAKKMAKAGFFHCPTDVSDDLVQCFSCGKALDGWEFEDDPVKEHAEHSKDCAFVQQLLQEPRNKENEQLAAPMTAVKTTRTKKITTAPTVNVFSHYNIQPGQETMTVAEFLKYHCDLQVQRLREAGEQQIAVFLEEAQAARMDMSA